VSKYDREAATYSSRYADPDAIADRQLALLSSWGTPVPPGARVAEIGCADGFVTLALARAGYRVTAIDMSASMLEGAESRLRSNGFRATFIEADVNSVKLDDQDAVLAQMYTFFSYAQDPRAALERLAARAPKVLIDVNPRLTPISKAVAIARSAGFGDVSWRPFFVPQRYRAGPVVRASLRAAERTPGVRGAILRKKFVVVIRGER
jgi:SAM-dependent methyltransferase